jgi:hypothetical protein
MAAESRYKVLDLSPDPAERTWAEQIQDTINQQAREGWELVTGFQREHEGQQVGSAVTHVSGLITTVLVFRRTG